MTDVTGNNRKPRRNHDFISTSDVLKRVKVIEDKYKEGGVSVPEAQGLEAELHKDVLTAIYTGNCTNIKAMACLAVKIQR